jgi:hypothetical protein
MTIAPSSTQPTLPTTQQRKRNRVMKSITQLAFGLTTLALLATAMPNVLSQPTITKQPTDQFVDSGKNARFQLSAAGMQPLADQWFFNGSLLVDATNNTLSVTNAQLTNAGEYLAVVSDASGTVTSQVARLKVFVPAVHNFNSIAIASNRSVALGLAGETTALFEQYFDLHPLEAASNLVDWSPLATLLRTNAATSSLIFSDADAPQFIQRFYRTPTNLLITPLPNPTGPYPVGTFSRLLTDPSRTNTVRHTNQQFVITFWYPAVGQAGSLPAPYVEKQLAQDSTVFESFVNRVPAFFSHSPCIITLVGLASFGTRLHSRTSLARLRPTSRRPVCAQARFQGPISFPFSTSFFWAKTTICWTALRLTTLK